MELVDWQKYCCLQDGETVTNYRDSKNKFTTEQTQHHETVFSNNWFREGCILRPQQTVQEMTNLDFCIVYNISETSGLQFKGGIFNQLIVKANNKAQKTSLIRFFLEINTSLKAISFLIHPLTNYICIRYRPLLSFNNSTNLLQDCETFKYQCSLTKEYFLKMLQILNFSLEPQPNFKPKYKPNAIKGFIKVSPYYAWTMLKVMTQSKREKNKIHYEQVRRQFIQSYKEEKHNGIISQISKFYNKDAGKKIQQFQNPSYEIEKQFQTTYLAKPQPSKAKLINEITISEDNLMKLIQNKQGRIECHQLGKLNVLIKLKSKHQMRHQRLILEKLPNHQHLGIPKYYYIKNQPNQICYVLNNLVNSVEFKRYLSTNSESMSFITQLHMLHQISLALKILRDYNIVYHKLIPSTILVKKGLFIKLEDFSNAYHYEVVSIQQDNDPPALCNFLPYVSNYQARINSSYGDQKSDIFSFGNIVYQTLYGKPPLQIKITEEQFQIYCFSKLFKPNIICPEKAMKYGNLDYQHLTFIALQCVNHEKVFNKHEKLNQDQIKTINIKSRPHLDWMIVITRSILQNQKRKTMLQPF